jgi:hypothetical protein
MYDGPQGSADVRKLAATASERTNLRIRLGINIWFYRTARSNPGTNENDLFAEQI